MDTLQKGTTVGQLKMAYDEAKAYAVEVTYSQLVALRNESKLIAGRWYRITDYVTTTTQENTQSAGHVFDIIVTADEPNKLNENARAALHSGDTYFANSKLESWEIKYCLDNINWSLQRYTYTIGDYTWFTAPSKGSDGYYRWNRQSNESYYTESLENGAVAYFNHGGMVSAGQTLSVVSSDTEGFGTITWMKDENDNECPYDFKNIQFKRWKAADAKASTRNGLNNCYMVARVGNTSQDLSVADTNDYIYAFTFSSESSGGTQTDYSLSKSNNVYNNVILSLSDSLNNIVFYGSNNYGNSFGNGCNNNSFGNSSHSNSFGNNCCSNSFGNNCYSNSFGNNCCRNSFGNSSHSNSFGNNCYSNSFRNNCNNNSFGVSCCRNSFGNNCGGNTFGDSCNNNSFGNYCGGNTFGNSCNYIVFQKDYIYYVVVENGNQHINVTSTQTTSSSSNLKNFTIAQGVNNSNTVKTISHNTVNDTFKTTYQNANSQIISV